MFSPKRVRYVKKVKTGRNSKVRRINSQRSELLFPTIRNKKPDLKEVDLYVKLRNKQPSFEKLGISSISRNLVE